MCLVAPPAAIPSEGLGNDDVSTLPRQGELWRAILSGEKNATELLDIDDYLNAARDLAARMHSILRDVVARFPLLIGLVAMLLVAGVVLLIIGGGSEIVAGAASLIAAVGLTWRGVGGAVGRLAGKLEQPLWGAVLDIAIADAITLLPAGGPPLPPRRPRREIALEMADPSRRAG